MHAIRTRDLRHEYKPHFWSRPQRGLRGLDLCVEEGEIFGFLGANGAGKTTTIKILVGLLTPLAGEAELFGLPVRRTESRRQVGFAPESPCFYEYLSAREALRLYAALSDLPRAGRGARADELLEFVGLREAAAVRLKDFSKGMRQRLGIAQAIVHRPRLVILDEPQSGLDPAGRRLVREAILRLKADGSTVFFSSHILSDVEEIADRVGLIVDGRLEACGRVEELVRAEVRGVEIEARGLPAGWAPPAGAAVASAPAGTLRFVVPDDEAANAALRRLLADGAEITLYRQLRETLEEYFMRTTGRGAAEVGAWSGGADR